MATGFNIERVHAREVLDSRGNPTVEVEVTLDGGGFGRAIVPSGASTGRHEALELRDGEPDRYGGRGVRQAVGNVNDVIGPRICGRGVDAREQGALDDLLRGLDGTAAKSNLGANAILGVSLGAAHAAAQGLGEPLYRYLANGRTPVLPLPMVNIISGGQHSNWSLDLQDFLAIPVGASSYGQALEWCGAVYRGMRSLLEQRGILPGGVADEGGFGPVLPANRDALELMVDAVELAGLKPGVRKDVAIGLDVAATEFFREGCYRLHREGRDLTTGEMVEMLAGWVEAYPIVSIEDGLAEDDWKGWQALKARIGERVQLIGDDLFTTNPLRLRMGIERKAANAVLVKPNQIGTLTETLEVVSMAQAAGFLPVISARSGETEDSTIADLAVGTAAGQIKIGSLTRSERLAKYNRLLRIEDELGAEAAYAGRGVLERFTG